jgi:hypothetical protein
MAFSSQSNANIASKHLMLSYRDVLNVINRSAEDAQRVAELAAAVRGAQVENKENVDAQAILNWIPNPVPQVGKAPTPEQVARFVEELAKGGCFGASPSIANVGNAEELANSNKLKKKAHSSFTYVINSVAVKADVSARAALAEACAEFPGSAAGIIERIDGCIKSTGSAHAVYRRLQTVAVDQMSRKLDESPDVKQLMAEFLHSIPFNQEVELPDSEEKMCEAYLTINATASSGAPWPNLKQGDKKALQEHLSWFREAFAASVKGPTHLTQLMKQWKEDYPSRMVLLLKAKFEVIELKNFETKARPYIVAPMWVNLMGKVSFGFVKSMWQSFFHDEACHSALGFSWAYGGAEGLVSYLHKCTVGNPRWVTYGDDSAISVRLNDGRVVMFFPDVSGMDYNLSRSMVELIRTTFYMWFRRRQVPKNIMYLMKLVDLFRTGPVPMALGTGPQLVEKRSGNASGISATTEVNDLANQATMSLTLIPSLSHKFDTPEEAEAALRAGARDALERVGMRYKPDTLNFKVATDELPVPGEFLGFQVRRLPQGCIPAKADPDEFIVSVFRNTHPEKLSEQEKLRRDVAQLHGLYLTGGFLSALYTSFYKKQMRILKVLARAKNVDLDSVDYSWDPNATIPEISDDPEVAVLLRQTSPITHATAIALYTLNREKFRDLMRRDFRLEAGPVPEEPPVGVQSDWFDLSEFEFSENPIPPASLSDAQAARKMELDINGVDVQGFASGPALTVGQRLVQKLRRIELERFKHMI